MPNTQWIRKALPFALLCVFASTSWLLPEHFPNIHFSLTGEAISCAFLAVLCFGIPTKLPKELDHNFFSAVVGGTLVLIAPSLGTLLNVTTVSQSGLTIALALTSAVVAVASPALSNTEFSISILWPGIVAAAALLIAAPVPSLADWRNDLVLFLTPLAAGIGSVLYVRSTANNARKMAAAFALTAIVFLCVAVIQHASQNSPFQISTPGIAISAVLVLLSLLALSNLSAAQYAARYALVPFLLLAEAPILLSVAMINMRTVFSALLLLAASVTLLRASPEENVA